MGVVCPLGAMEGLVWEQALAGRSAILSLTLTNAANGAQLTIPAASVPQDALASLPKATSIMTDKFTRFALMAAADAITNSGIELESEDRARFGVSSGSCMNGITETEVGFNCLYIRGRPKVHPFTLVRTMPNAPAAYIAMTYGLTGPALHYSTTCSSSAVAVGEAARSIRHGYADVMIAGGTESMLTYSAVNCWHSAQLLAPMHEDPSQSCRPFDRTRNGTVLGEGAVFIVLEEWDRARARRANIRAELAGYSCAADSGHATQPSVFGQAHSMKNALADAELPGDAIAYIHAHGTATKLNDAVETQAIKAVFGAHAAHLAISSSKAIVGHMVGAAGAMGLLFAVKAMERRQVPPTANLLHPDPDCDLDYIPGTGRDVPRLAASICNAFGFGGSAATLVVTRPQ